MMMNDGNIKWWRLPEGSRHSQKRTKCCYLVVSQAWAVYLRKDAKKAVSPYAAPARRTDYTGLPPAYTFVCTAEPFYCETLTFIDNMRRAGVEAEVDVYDGLYHAFDMREPDSPAGKKAIARFNERFAYAKEHYFAEQR